ncbi:hypothetical protein [Aquibacillus sediminis]|uniref:hypothetical protein n=1 Tax=Aquibacillus sediminis TaxID=2574734 RepID=UPI00110A09A4|nr:hypothetical protein [Aquibacillus sediminis]
MKKWIIITGVILLSISQERYRFSEFLNMILEQNIAPTENFLLTIPLLLMMELIGGFLHILGSLWEFALSWEGVLLIAVILLHSNIREYMKKS